MGAKTIEELESEVRVAPPATPREPSRAPRISPNDRQSRALPPRSPRTRTPGGPPPRGSRPPSLTRLALPLPPTPPPPEPRPVSRSSPSPTSTQRADLEQEAYDEKNKLLNQSQFQDLLELETDEEPEFMREIVEMYIADANDMLEELKENFAKPAPDYAQARATLHKLKGSSSTFGADGVQAKCEALREHCVKEDLERCREGEGSLAELGTNISDLSAFLARYTAKAKEIHEAKAAAASAAEKTS